MVGNDSGEDLVEYRDYVYLNKRHWTLSMFQEYAESVRDEMVEAEESIKALTFSEDDLKKQSLELTNLMGLVGANLSRAYALLRDAKRRRDELAHLLEDLVNAELADNETRVPGANQKERDAYFAVKYAMLFAARRFLDDFIGSELQEYVNELATMDRVLSRQTSTLDLEYRISHG